MNWARLRDVSVGTLVGVMLTAGAVAWANGRPDTLYRKLEVLAEVLGHIENHYVEPPGAADLIYGAAEGAILRLDEHSDFFPPEDYQDLLDSTDGEFVGIGMEIRWEDEVPEVVSVLDDSPAKRAGMRVGDRLLKIDGEPAEGHNLNELYQMLKGPVGTFVTLTMQRGGPGEDPWEFTLQRAWIRVTPLAVTELGDGLLSIRVKTFSRGVAADLESALTEHSPKGLVLDLRGNPGGLFDEAVAICDLFLTDGLIVTALGRNGKVLEKIEATSHRTQSDYPIAILIDGGSASASEVVAGALADRERATLFGQRSYGKGSVQSILELSDGSGLKLTVARYYTPSGRKIDSLGIVPKTLVELDAPGDKALALATQWLRDEV